MDNPSHGRSDAGPGAGGASPPRFKGRILLAEDSPINQLVAKKLLGIFGCEVEVAESGEGALALWEGRPFDLIFLDCRMPGMDGYEVARIIRKREEGEDKRIPIVALTAETTLDERKWCLEAGMDDFLPKPITAETVQAILARWLSGGPGGGPPPPARAAAPGGESPVIRLETLAVFLGGGRGGEPDEETLEKMVSLFLSLAPPKLQALREAAGRGDGPAIRELAHSLKSSAYAMGAWRMVDICD
ncbi:MAG: response regulator, partial [Nitrospinota bacterium]